MRKYLLILSICLAGTWLNAAVPNSQPVWKAKVASTIPLLGHRNWILVVDSAYPLQSSAGIETLETSTDQLEVVQYVLGAINSSIHVRPLIYMDAELPFVPDEDAPGANAYRKQIESLLHSYKVEALPHDKLIATVDDAGKQFHILVLKTKLAIPYTSVFIRLDCKYWSADMERRLRARMTASAVPTAR